MITVFDAAWGRRKTSVLVDSGWDEEVVYDFCLRRKNCAPCKGTPAERPYVIKEAEQTREKGQYLGRRFSLWMVNSNRIREHIHDRIGIPAGEPRSWRLHADTSLAYRQHITSWARQEKRVKGRAVVEWVQVRKDDHWLDAEIYAIAAARPPHFAPLLLTERRPRPRRPALALAGAARWARVIGCSVWGCREGDPKDAYGTDLRRHTGGEGATAIIEVRFHIGWRYASAATLQAAAEAVRWRRTAGVA